MIELFQRLCTDAPLPAIEAVLDEPGVVADLANAEATRAYPAHAVERLQRAGLAELFAGERATVPHGCALSAMLARRSGSLAVAIGVNYLGLVPIYMAADDVEDILARVRAGAFASLALSERASGSDLAAIETTAVDDRITGVKDLINGGARHEILVVLARGGLFVVPRGREVTAGQRWHTLAVRGADISSVRFDRAPGTRLGREGDASTIVSRTLVLTRGGIGAFAAGTASRCSELAHAYARERRIAGRPIAELGAIAAHLRRLRANALAATCAAIKACCALNAVGAGAVVASSVAKLAGCDAAERAVTEGRHVLGARALLPPYEQLVRDVLVFGTFDGTRHVVLEQLAWRLAQLAANGPTGSLVGCYALPPRPLRDVCRARDRAVIPDPQCPELLAAVRAARASGAWDRDQALRFELAAIYADLEMATAIREIAPDDPDAAFAIDAIAKRCAVSLDAAIERVPNGTISPGVAR